MCFYYKLLKSIDKKTYISHTFSYSLSLFDGGRITVWLSLKQRHNSIFFLDGNKDISIKKKKKKKKVETFAKDLRNIYLFLKTCY